VLLRNLQFPKWPVRRPNLGACSLVRCDHGANFDGLKRVVATYGQDYLMEGIVDIFPHSFSSLIV